MPLSDTGELIARSSRITEPYLREFVKGIVRETKPRKILDVGCGTGIYMKYAAEFNQSLEGIGIDLKERVARLASENLSRWRIADRFKIIAGDIRNLISSQELEGSFDVITLYNNVYYFSKQDRVQLFQKLRMQLSPHGLLAIASLTRFKNKNGRATVMSADFDAVLRSTIGSAPLPRVDELREQLLESGFINVKVQQLIPFEPYYGIIART